MPKTTIKTHIKPLVRISYYITRASAIIVILTGLLVLMGWQLNIVVLKQILLKAVAMNPMSALLFVLCGISFLLHRQKGFKHHLALALAVLVMLIAALRMMAVPGLYDAGIDRLLFTEKLQTTIYSGTPNHMVPHAALAFFICGLSLFFLINGRVNTSQWLVLPVNGLSILSVVGYSYHISSFYVVTSFIPLSFHEGICLNLLSMALLLADSTKGFMGEVTNLHAGGKAARILLPALVMIPAFLGYFVLKGIFKGHFSVVVWMALFVCAVIFMFGLLVWTTARIINKSEAKRLLEKQKAEEELRQMTEYKIKQSQERFYTLMNSVDGIVWEADAQNFAFTFISKQAEQILGYPTERWVTEPTFWADHIIEDDRTWAVSFCAAATAQGRPHQFEYRMIAADGRILWLRDFVSVLMENKKPVKLSGIMVDITEQKKMEEELREKERSQQKLITEITILAQEKERNELGLELHDNINQLLSVVKLYLGRAKTETAVRQEMIDKSYLHLEEAIRDIRKLSHSLVAPSLGHDGLKEALEDLARSVQDLNKIDIQLLLDEDFEHALQDKKKELMLYRIVQEQLTNIVKYANATEVVICLQLQENNLSLLINDNGVGFDMQVPSNGIGLKNINSRVHFYAGKMMLTSAPGEGCTLEILVPN